MGNKPEEVAQPSGQLTFKAIKSQEGNRIEYVGKMPVAELIEKRFIVPAASDGLSEEILKLKNSGGPVQRKTNPAHVQAIVDYIVQQAEAAEPWAFNSIVLYSTAELMFEGVSFGFSSAGEARATERLSVGEGLHRSLAWAVALGLAKVRGVKRPPISPKALKRIEAAAIPVLVIEEPDLARQKSDFNKLNRQKPLTSTVLSLTETDSRLSDLTRHVVADVHLFDGRIDLNNASVGTGSDKLLSFAQLRFVVASYLLGKKTRSKKAIEEGVDAIVEEQGSAAVRGDLKSVFSLAASNLGGLAEIQSGKIKADKAGDQIRTVRHDTLLASNAAWRALFVALHDAAAAGVDPETAMKRVRRDPKIWGRKSPFWRGNLIDRDTGKLLSNRESIDAASKKLLGLMTAAD